MKLKRQGVRRPARTGFCKANPGAGLAQLALKPTAIDKFLYLSTIRKNNVHLFYRLVSDHLRVRWPVDVSRKSH